MTKAQVTDPSATDDVLEQFEKQSAVYTDHMAEQLLQNFAEVYNTQKAVKEENKQIVEQVFNKSKEQESVSVHEAAQALPS